MILQSLVLAILRWRDEIPDKTLNLLIALVVFDAIHQQGPTDHLHVLLIQVPLEPPMGQDIFPASPAETEGTQTKHSCAIKRPCWHLSPGAPVGAQPCQLPWIGMFCAHITGAERERDLQD